MEFTIAQSVLLSMLSLANKAISSRIISPVFAYFKVDVSFDSFKLTASNSDLTIVTTLPEEKKDVLRVFKDGSCVLHARYLTDIVRRIHESTITFTQLDTTCIQISTATSQSTLNTIDVAQYPILTFLQDEPTVAINRKVFQKVLRKTIFCVSKLETRPILTGLHFQIHNNTLSVVATDTHRAASIYVEDLQGQFTGNCIVPATALQELLRIFDEVNDDMIIIRMNRQKFSCQFQDVIFESTVIEGRFPDISQAFSGTFPTKVTLPATSLLHSLERAALLARTTTNNMVILTLQADTFEVSSLPNEVGVIHETIVPIAYEGPSLTIAFNVDYVIEAIKAISSDTVLLCCSNALKLALILDPADTNYRQIILPVNK